MCKSDLTASSWCYSTLSSGREIDFSCFLWGTRDDLISLLELGGGVLQLSTLDIAAKL